MILSRISEISEKKGCFDDFFVKTALTNAFLAIILSQPL